MINTVRGKISKDKLGKTYMHEHIIADLSGVRKDNDSVMTDVSEALAEIEYAISAGINTFLDVSCIGMGRDVGKLKEISEKSGVNIICSTGFYLKSYYPQYIFEEEAEQIAERLIAEIESGIDGTGIKPGIIGEIATGKNEFDLDNKKIFKAAALSHKKTGLPITTHCSEGTMALEQIEFLTNLGVKNTKIIVGHMDLLTDFYKLAEIFKTGVYLGFDTIGKNTYISEEERLKTLYRALNEGWGSQIVLSEDISRKSYYKSRGGLGYGYLISSFLPKLVKMGISQKDIDTMLIHNPANMLDVEFSERMRILVNNNVISEKAAFAANEYMEIIEKSHHLDRKHNNFDMFETHLAVCFDRAYKNELIEEFPPELEEEISGKWFTNLAIKTLKAVCEHRNIAFSEAEGKYIGVHLGVLLKEDNYN